jgi:hypothetical protein
MKTIPPQKTESSTPANATGIDPTLRAASRLHLQFGWWSLFVFLTLGLGLETLDGFKVGWYVNVSNETRRLMWTLAHAHGTLIGLVQIAFGLTIRLLPLWNATKRALAGTCLIAANILLPGGFLLGGLRLYGGDPGLGVLLVPVGGVLLFTTVFLTARQLRSSNI